MSLPDYDSRCRAESERGGGMVVSRVNCAGVATSSMGRDAATSLEIFDRRTGYSGFTGGN